MSQTASTFVDPKYPVQLHIHVSLYSKSRHFKFTVGISKYIRVLPRQKVNSGYCFLMLRLFCTFNNELNSSWFWNETLHACLFTCFCNKKFIVWLWKCSYIYAVGKVFMTETSKSDFSKIKQWQALMGGWECCVIYSIFHSKVAFSQGLCVFIPKYWKLHCIFK